MTDELDLSKLTLEQKKEMIQELRKKKQSELFHNDEEKWAHYAQFKNYPRYQEIKKLFDYWNGEGGTGLVLSYLKANDGVNCATSIVDGKELINFGGYNYLNLSGHPDVKRKTIATIEKYGTSSSASRHVSGTKPIHLELEKNISAFLGTEGSIVFPSGYLTNASVIGYLMSAKDLIVHDILSHNSIVAGSLLSPAHRLAFPHNDYKALEQILKGKRNDFERVLIVVEGVYSMDGDIPNLPELIRLKKKYGAWLMIDEAHSIGVIGKTGRGIAEYFSIDRSDIEVNMGTLSKSLGSCGGFISGSNELMTFLHACPGFIFSAAITPSDTAAALASLEIMQQEPERLANLQENARYFLSLCKAKGLNTSFSKDSAIVPVLTGDSLITFLLSQRLAERGINALPIGYPAVEKEASRVRYFISTSHTKEQLQYTAECTAEELNKLKKEIFGAR